MDTDPKSKTRPPSERGGSGPRGLDGITAFLDLRWTSATELRMTIRPDLINRGGLLSGVATYAMVDYSMGSALWVKTREQESIATINIAINYIQTATEGEVIATSQVDRRNRTGAVLRSEVHHEDGRLLATAVGSYSIFARRHAPADSLVGDDHAQRDDR